MFKRPDCKELHWHSAAAAEHDRGEERVFRTAVMDSTTTTVVCTNSELTGTLMLPCF